MLRVYIAAAGRNIDGAGTLDGVERKLAYLKDRHLPIEQLTIAPLSAGWETALPAHHYSGGNAPLEALAQAHRLLHLGEAEFVLIHGRDHLRTGYSEAERRRHMAIYGERFPLAQLYDHLAHAFMAYFDLSQEKFLQLRDLLLDNYLKTARQQPGFTEPAPEAFEEVTPLFRHLDCPGHAMDFEGALLLTRGERLEEFSLRPRDCIRVSGTGIGLGNGDGPDYINELAQFRPLRKAVFYASLQAGELDFADAFKQGAALLEVDSSYPVIPLGFLLASGIAEYPAKLAELICSHPLTVTGGRFLGKAAWNNSALNSLIAMTECLLAGPQTLGGVHGTSGLGYRQGFAILERPD